MPRPALKLLSSMAMREALAELVDMFERESGRRVAREAAGGVDVAKRIQAGEPVDVVVLSSSAIDKLIEQGRLQIGSRVDLARSGVAVAVRAGARKPEISSEDALRRTVLAAASIAYSTGPSGVHLERVFERWGIRDQIAPRIVVAPPGVPVGTLVAKGEAELGFQQLSELTTLAGIEVVGPLPESIQILTVFSGGVGAASAEPEEARRLLSSLASPAATAIKQRYGMDAA